MKTLIYELSKNNIPFYIGKSTESVIENRKGQHIITYGKDITFSIIDEIEGTNKSIWKPLECYWITQYKVWGFKLINQNEGGSGSLIKRTKEEIKEYHRKKSKEYYKNLSEDKKIKYKEYKKIYLKEWQRKNRPSKRFSSRISRHLFIKFI